MQDEIQEEVILTKLAAGVEDLLQRAAAEPRFTPAPAERRMLEAALRHGALAEGQAEAVAALLARG